jgi:general secretion pathway protein F
MDEKGLESEGNLDADSYDELVARLEKRGLFLVNATPVTEPARVQASATVSRPSPPRAVAGRATAPPPGYGRAERRLTSMDLLILSQQLEFQLASGIPLAESLDFIADQPVNARIKRVIGILLAEIRAGNPLSAAMEKVPNDIPAFVRFLVKAGEESGKLSEVFGSAVRYIERTQDMIRKIRAIFVYPLFLALTAGAVLLFMTLVILPALVATLQVDTMKLPRFTVFLIDAMSFVKNHRFPIIGLAVGATAALWYAWTLRGRSARVDRALLGAPLFGPIARLYVLARFTGTLGLLLQSAVPILESLRIVRSVVTEIPVSAELDEVHDMIRNGFPLSAALSQRAYFPQLTVNMVATGERTGKLDEVLLRLNAHYEKTLENRITELFQWIEPALILFLAVFVGALVIGLLYPVLTISEML